MVNSAAKKVPGRKTTVITMIVFIDELPSGVVLAKRALASASLLLPMESSCVMRATN